MAGRNGGGEMAGAKWRGRIAGAEQGKPSKRFFRQALLSFIVILYGNGFGLVLMYIIPPFRFFSDLSIWPRFASDLVCAQSLFRIIFISCSSRQAAVSPRFLLHNFAVGNAYPLSYALSAPSSQCNYFLQAHAPLPCKTSDRRERWAIRRER